MCDIEQIINIEHSDIKTHILAEIALDLSKKISKMNEKIGLILKH